MKEIKKEIPRKTELARDITIKLFEKAPPKVSFNRNIDGSYEIISPMDANNLFFNLNFRYSEQELEQILNIISNS